MVAALIPLLASAIPAVVRMFNQPAAAPAHPATPTAAATTPIVLPPVQQPMPQYALTPQGQMVQLPAQQQAALMQLAQAQQMQPLEQHAALVGRAQVRHTQAAMDPQLEEIRRQLNQQALQTQATSEHRRIKQRESFQRAVLGRLGAIERAARISRY